MQLWRSAAAGLAVLLAAVLPSAGQDGPSGTGLDGEIALAEGRLVSTVLVLRQDDLFEGSAFGRASQARSDAASRDLIAENRAIEAGLEAEERDLTTRRAALPAAEFRELAEAFNDKVEDIRAAQDAKARAIGRLREQDRARFLRAVVPVLAELMAERGAVVILDPQVVVLSFDRVDITDEAVTRIDDRIGEGDLAAEPTDPADAP